MTNSNIHKFAEQHGSGVQDNVKYRYALDENQCVIEIGSELVVKSKDYTCLSCGKILRPVIGRLRKKHFRHKVHVDCSSETYLHNLAKLVFLQTYKECVSNKRPYIIEYKVPKRCDFCRENGPCNIGYELKKADLTRYYWNIAPEVRDNEFIPDLLLTSGSNSLYVEIAVTHFVEEKKATSGMKIIEIHIDNESDIDLITSCLLSEDDARVSIHGFRKDPVLGDFSNECQKTVNCFILHPSGRSIKTFLPALEFENIAAKGVYVEKIDEFGRRSAKEEFIDRVGKAFKKGLKIKNCWLCTFHCLQYRTHESFCRLHKTVIANNNQAVDCKKYRPIEVVPDCGLMMNAINQANNSRNKGSEQQQAKRNISPPPVPASPPKQKPEPYPLLEMITAGFLKTHEVACMKLSGEEIKRTLDNDAEDPFLNIIFHGVTVNCASCGSELMLVTSANVSKCSVVIDSWDFVQHGGEFYNSPLLNRILEATACEEDKSLKFVCKCLVSYSKGRVLAVECPSCSEVSPLSSSYNPGQIFQRKMHYRDYSKII